ncbi:c-type cytochrome [Tardiphaga sp. 20_F10_N6_6]|jgi:cytochrome c556|uniref:c-type cytochrome n=1 Tax=Tardiphaga TaxID=1395974 RepID=UPI0008A74145|nr:MULTISPECIES: cytochrome c [Tardiphaga]MDR6663748.1 cytochrome c556 [Tardiphaga robiniae]NUU41241.1 cytochrome c [Tardiphaga robiniae]UFS73353.1 cytochrome c [Tardiphaga sp. 37S4]SEI23725.1 Cytochrome c556 [Tardiphaga sp. OK245]
MKRALLVVGALLLGVGAVSAQQEIVKERQTLMKSNGRALGGTLSAMAKGDKPYDQAAVEAALTVLDETAKKLPTLFPDSTKGLKAEGDYSTSPKVWEDKAGFDAHIVTFAKAVTDAKAKIKDLDSLKANVGGIGKACGGCHETFRLKI